MQPVSDKPVYVVILAGGQGTRLWPISMKARPKQFLDLAGNGRSLLQDTVRRALELTGSIKQVLVLSQEAHASLVREQLPDLPQENVLIEPVGRNTAACLGLAAVRLSQDLGEIAASETVMLSLPVDHMFRDEEPWFMAVRTAIAVASRMDSLVAIGVKPTRPATGYGYQQLGGKVELDLPLEVYALREFVEKPPHEMAQAFLESGDYLWNTGTYAWQIGTFLAALEEHAPELYSGLRSLGNPVDVDRLAEIYPKFENLSVDHAVMEKAHNVVTLRADFERIDVGSLASLLEIWQSDEQGNVSLGELQAENSRDNIVYNEGGLVTLIGVNDLIVIRTGKIILVCPRDKADEIKNAVVELKQRGMEDYL